MKARAGPYRLAPFRVLKASNPQLDFRAIFFPGGRADPSLYWLGLGLIAALDAVRLTLINGIGLLSFVVIAFFVASLHINRLRDAGRSASIVALPLVLGLAAKLIIGLGAMMVHYMPVFYEFLAAQGVDINDSAAVQAAAFDPALQAAHEAYMMNNPDEVYAMLRAAAWPSTWAFWILVGLLGRWFARLPHSA
jgi:uncharacterized membrane protein YhaH (DUF805 family)